MLVLVLGNVSRVVGPFYFFDDLIFAPHEDLGEELESSRLGYFLFFVQALNGNRLVSFYASFFAIFFEETTFAGVEKIGSRSKKIVECVID